MTCNTSTAAADGTHASNRVYWRVFVISQVRPVFKRLISALSAKQDDKAAEPTPAAPPAAAAGDPAVGEPTAGRPAAGAPDDGDLITVYDAYGRELRITRPEWREKVFLPNLREQWNDPAGLYNLILSGLNDDLAADLPDAAARLVEIDPIAERSHTVNGIVLMKLGRLDEAEATLRAGMERAGATGTLLTNLAKVQTERGDETAADQTLWRALETDPNLDNGLSWWASIQRERGGDAGYVQGLQRVAALPGSWRAQLWLARADLEQGRTDAAVARYRAALAGGQLDAHALTMISGDLGRNGQIPLILELVGPAYDPERHDPMTGLNLLRACQELGNADAGEALLERLYALGHQGLKQHLDQFAGAFQEMRTQASTSKPVDPADFKVSTLALSQPVWHYGLRNPKWFFTQKPEGTPEVAFFVFTVSAGDNEQTESQREDERGRLTRSLPLYLAEATRYWTDLAATAYFLVVEGGGPVVSAGAHAPDALFGIVPPQTRYLVTGEVEGAATDTGPWQVTVHLWDCAERRELARETGQASPDTLGALTLELEQRLLAHLGGARAEPLDAFYRRPDAAKMPIYLSYLSQAFTLTLLATGTTPKANLWGERAMLDWPIKMTLQWPDYPALPIMALSGLGKAREYGSEVLGEYRERALQLLRDHRDAPVARLEPVVWRAFGMTAELDACARNPAGDAAHGEWIARLQEA